MTPNTAAPSFTPEVLVLGLSIGLLLSLMCYLATNLSPGGMMSPGWLTLLLLEDAKRFLVLLIVIVGTYAAMMLLQRSVILYGKRLFATSVLVATFLQVTASLLLIDLFPTLFSTTTLGFIVPGLIAYQFIRQPIGATMVSMVAVTGVTYAIILSGVLLELIPRV